MKVVNINSFEPNNYGYNVEVEFENGDTDLVTIYKEVLDEDKFTTKEIIATVLEDFPYTLNMEGREHLIRTIHEILLDQAEE